MTELVAATVAHLRAVSTAATQEQMEVFILERIEGGAALRGTYPPDAATLAAYEAWRTARGLDNT